MSAVLNQSQVFAIIEPQDIDAVWPYVEQGVSEALATSNGEATVDDTKQGLVAGRTQLMLIHDAGQCLGVVFQILHFPQYKIGRVLLAFGKGMAKLRYAIECAESWAKGQGCKYVEAWVATASRLRLFARFGYSPTYTIIRKALT